MQRLDIHLCVFLAQPADKPAIIPRPRARTGAAHAHTPSGTLIHAHGGSRLNRKCLGAGFPSFVESRSGFRAATPKLASSVW